MLLLLLAVPRALAMVELPSLAAGRWVPANRSRDWFVSECLEGGGCEEKWAWRGNMEEYRTYEGSRDDLQRDVDAFAASGRRLMAFGGDSFAASLKCVLEDDMEHCQGSTEAEVDSCLRSLGIHDVVAVAADNDSFLLWTASLTRALAEKRVMAENIYFVNRSIEEKSEDCEPKATAQWPRRQRTEKNLFGNETVAFQVLDVAPLARCSCFSSDLLAASMLLYRVLSKRRRLEEDDGTLILREFEDWEGYANWLTSHNTTQEEAPVMACVRKDLSSYACLPSVVVIGPGSNIRETLLNSGQFYISASAPDHDFKKLPIARAARRYAEKVGKVRTKSMMALFGDDELHPRRVVFDLLSPKIDVSLLRRIVPDVRFILISHDPGDFFANQSETSLCLSSNCNFLQEPRTIWASRSCAEHVGRVVEVAANNMNLAETTKALIQAGFPEHHVAVVDADSLEQEPQKTYDTLLSQLSLPFASLNIPVIDDDEEDNTLSPSCQCPHLTDFLSNVMNQCQLRHVFRCAVLRQNDTVAASKQRPHRRPCPPLHEEHHDDDYIIPREDYRHNMRRTEGGLLSSGSSQL